jgi:DNA invertase Pin-like site-specific DNA recombinase
MEYVPLDYQDLVVEFLENHQSVHQIIHEICAMTATLVIDEDGCYDPGEFNDALLLGLKATIAQAELHFIRARLLGGKLNRAKKGEFRFPLPAGFPILDN